MRKSSVHYKAVSLLFWQYCVLAALLGVFASDYPFYSGLCFALLCVFVAGHYASPRLFRLCCLVLFFGAASGYAQWREPLLSERDRRFAAERFDPMSEYEICGKIEQVQSASDRRLRLVLSGVHVKEGGVCRHEGPKLGGKLLLTWDGLPLLFERPPAGPYFSAKTRIRPFYESLRNYYSRKDIWHNAWLYGVKKPYQVRGEADFWSLKREKIRFAAEQKLLGPLVRDGKKPYSSEFQARALVLALFFGDRFYVTQKALDSFNQSNLLHSLALSGQHLSLAAFFAALLVFGLSRCFPRMYLYKTKYFFLTVFGLVLGFVYCWIGAAPYSLLRAYAMLLLGALFYFSAKNVTLLDILFCALALFLLFDPLAVFDLGVQLSFVSVFVIALLVPFLRYSKNRLFSFLKGRMKFFVFSVYSLFVVSFGVQVALMPLLLAYFGQVSWFFPLNVVWLPVLGFWVMPLAAVSLCLPVASVSAFLLETALFPVHCLLALFEFFARHDVWFFLQGIRPLGLNFIGFYLLLLCLFYRKGNRLFSFFSAVGVFFLFVPVFCRMFEVRPDLQIALYDVGQGQALYVRTKEQRMLVDTGGTSSRRFNVGKDIVAKRLTVNQSPYLDRIFASHDDSDHINGIAPILKTFAVREFYENAVYGGKTSYARKKLDNELKRQKLRPHFLGTGDRIDLGGGYAWEVLYPPLPEKFAPERDFSRWALKKYDANSSSLVLRLVKNGRGLLLVCGDSGKKVLEKLSAMHDAGIVSLRSELLVLPHHGSADGFSPGFYSKASPKYVLVSCGLYNRYGFPAPEILDYFRERNIPVLSAAERGDIVFTEEGGRLFEGRKSFLQELYSVL